ncbi:MAG: DUF123 domain-containing protein [Desulfurococcaceae archaeon]
MDWNCYVLVLEVMCDIEAKLARSSVILKPGVYLYIGSSRGPGGALARIIRHVSSSKKAWWHVDSLTLSPCCALKGFYLLNSACKDCELEVSQRLARLFSYVPGFGSADKPQSPSHLFICSEDYENCTCKVYGILERIECVVDVIYVDAGGDNLRIIK